jgi:hypothetical protein
MSKKLARRKWWSGDCYLVCPLYEGALLLYRPTLLAGSFDESVDGLEQHGLLMSG